MIADVCNSAVRSTEIDLVVIGIVYKPDKPASRRFVKEAVVDLTIDLRFHHREFFRRNTELLQKSGLCNAGGVSFAYVACLRQHAVPLFRVTALLPHPFVKRVAAGPGQTVQITDGTLLIPGQKIPVTVFSVMVVSSRDQWIFDPVAADEEPAAYLDYVGSESKYVRTDLLGKIKAEPERYHVLTLSTCSTYLDENRTIVLAAYELTDKS